MRARAGNWQHALGTFSIRKRLDKKNGTEARLKNRSKRNRKTGKGISGKGHGRERGRETNLQLEVHHDLEGVPQREQEADRPHEGDKVRQLNHKATQQNGHGCMRDGSQHGHVIVGQQVAELHHDLNAEHRHDCLRNDANQDGLHAVGQVDEAVHRQPQRLYIPPKTHRQRPGRAQLNLRNLVFQVAFRVQTVQRGKNLLALLVGLLIQFSA